MKKHDIRDAGKAARSAGAAERTPTTPVAT